MTTQKIQKKEYDEYIASKHAKMMTSKEVVEPFVQKATGNKIKSMNRLMEGESNEVYECELENGEPVIVRVAHNKWSSFNKEEWALKKCKLNKIPAPEMILAEDFEVKGEFRSICVMKKLEGSALSSKKLRKKLGKTKLKSIFIQTGAILSKIHNIKTQGFGRISSQGQGKYKTWKESILQRLNKVERYKEISRKNSIPPEMVERAVQILKAETKDDKPPKPHLVHDDLGYKHIFVNKSTVTGLIDFEDARSDDPIWDFAWWNFFRDNKEEFEWVKKGYENKELFSSNFDERMNLYKLCLSWDLLDYYDEGNFQPGIEIAKKKLEESIKFFKSN